MNRQEEIIKEICVLHGITFNQGQEIFDLIFRFVGVVIAKEDNINSDGEYVIENFKSIHIDNFGKFIPKTKRIALSNRLMKKHKEDKLKEDGL
jgi:nucleoid DNA-binding protein